MTSLPQLVYIEVGFVHRVSKRYRRYRILSIPLNRLPNTSFRAPFLARFFLVATCSLGLAHG